MHLGISSIRYIWEKKLLARIARYRLATMFTFICYLSLLCIKYLGGESTLVYNVLLVQKAINFKYTTNFFFRL